VSTYSQLIYHIVFATKNREHTIVLSEKKRLLAFIHQLLTNKKCHLYRVNCMEDHIHMLTHVNTTISIAALVKDIKLASNEFILREGFFPKFKGWQDGYGAFSESIKSKNRLIEYIKNQEEHHRKITFLDEYRTLLEEHEIDFDQKYLL
jgi:REP element-mobilizing transposase RayT